MGNKPDTPLWIKVYDIPLEAWNVEGGIISSITSRIGVPIIMDKTTTCMCEKTVWEGRGGGGRLLLKIYNGANENDGWQNVGYRRGGLNNFQQEEEEGIKADLSPILSIRIVKEVNMQFVPVKNREKLIIMDETRKNENRGNDKIHEGREMPSLIGGMVGTNT
ncbi:hypothetical protein Tco_0866936 [Tanacetum coccineum]